MLALWNGPASVAVYIPAPKGSPQAATCRDQVAAYVTAMAERVDAHTARHGSNAALLVSFLYANHVSPNIHCHLTEDSTGLEAGYLDEALWQEQFHGKEYLTIYDAEYPVGALRQLAMNPVCPFCSLSLYLSAVHPPTGPFVYWLRVCRPERETETERVVGNRPGVAV